MRGKNMSSWQRRVSALHMQDYRDLMKRPVRGIITYGGGLNIPEWMREAEAQGFHVCMTPAGVELR